MDVVFTNIRPIWMLLQETRDVGSRWMPPTLRANPKTILFDCHHKQHHVNHAKIGQRFARGAGKEPGDTCDIL